METPPALRRTSPLAPAPENNDTHSPRFRIASIAKPRSIRLHLDTCGALFSSTRVKIPLHLAAGLGICLAFLCIFHARSTPLPHHDKKHPALHFPRASHSGRMPCNGHVPEVLSWKPQGGWISMNSGEIPTENLQKHLESVAERYRQKGVSPQIKIRIDSSQPAGHFIHLTRCMEKAGIPNLHISVFPADDTKM